MIGRRRRWILAWLVLLAALESQAAEVSAPNIVLIIGDDVGWMDHGFMGSETVRTPHLDRLAHGGTVFTHAFSTSSVCRPSLHTLLTGLYPFPIDHRFRALRKRVRLPLRELVDTLPARLAERGYASFQGGKFWEGTFQDGGFTHGMTRTLLAAHATKRPKRDPEELLKMSGSEGLALGRETMEPLWDFLDAHREKPFFVWFAPMLPHQPFDAPREFVEMYTAQPGKKSARAYWANMTRFDATVGALMTRLAALELLEKTIVVYVADNGWDAHRRQAITGGVDGKGSVKELGFRTPMIVSWPGQIAAGQRDDRLVSFVDVYPTLLSFADLAPGQVPGMSLKALLLGGGTFERKVVMGAAGVRGDQERFLRTDAWRYVRKEQSEELYRIAQDPHEAHDLSAKEPAVLKRMRVELDRQVRDAQFYRAAGRR